MPSLGLDTSIQLKIDMNVASSGKVVPGKDATETRTGVTIEARLDELPERRTR